MEPCSPVPGAMVGQGADRRGDGVGPSSAWTPRGLGVYCLLMCVCVCVCVCVYTRLHMPLVCEMGSPPHVRKCTGMPTHGHTQTQDSMTCHHSCAHKHMLLCAQKHILSLTCVRVRTHTHTQAHLPPSQPLPQPVCSSCRRRLLAPCPLIHLACQPVPGAPISFTPPHLAAQ